MFRVSCRTHRQEYIKLTTAAGTGHIIGAATSFQRGQATLQTPVQVISSVQLPHSSAAKPRWNEVAAPI